MPQDTQAKAQAKPTTEAQPQVAPEVTQDLELTPTQANHILNALGDRINATSAAIAHHEHEIKHPSLFNPQVEMHQGKVEILVAQMAELIALRQAIAEAFGFDISPIVIVTGEAAPGVTGPAEQNRPPQANPGAAGSNQV